MDLRCDGGGGCCCDVQMGKMAEKAELGFKARDTPHVARVVTSDMVVVVTSDGFKRRVVVKLQSTVVGEAEGFLRRRGEELTREKKIAEDQI
ncbi:hypothetical protein Bca4012_065438 [Brassica carinata]